TTGGAAAVHLRARVSARLFVPAVRVELLADQRPGYAPRLPLRCQHVRACGGHLEREVVHLLVAQPAVGLATVSAIGFAGPFVQEWVARRAAAAARHKIVIVEPAVIILQSASPEPLEA